MAEPKKNDYYEILRISPSADLRQIAEAIKHFREERDKSGNYTAIINKIEETLTDPELRVQYDFEHGHSGVKSGFVDIDESVLQTHYSTKTEHHTYDVRKELAEFSVLSDKNNSSVSLSFISLKNLIILSVVVLLALCAFILSKPIMDKMEGKKQAQDALALLKQSEVQVEGFIRQRGFYPQDLVLQNSDSRFSLRLDSQNNRVVLNFSGDVISDLRNMEMSNTFVTQPNLTYWKCDIGASFPAEYKPVKCF